jgi:hypothetical protein
MNETIKLEIYVIYTGYGIEPLTHGGRGCPPVEKFMN